ncbi:7-carboxy-7-deazaguanine synthase QueE [Ectobacillus polymachus]|uniref:7-carboxy-7-deazaguanine synthase QueE n=1 Tax=Ectobacillus polymachus TaxID=1508806 RepID=UPI003A8965CB
MTNIPVLEIFGPTIQGEGMVVGQKTMFVRTAGCDYHCSWCDSAFTWDGSGKNHIQQMSAEEIWTELIRLGGNRFSHVTLSGGNPVLIPAIGELITILKQHQIRIAIETQGSKWQDWLLEIDDITISPKPPSSQMETDFSSLDMIVERLKHRNMSLKVVVFDKNDFLYARKIHEQYPDVPFFLQVGNEDVHTENREALVFSLLKRYEWLVTQVMESDMNDVKVLPQLHALVWGNKRGV